MFMLLSLAFSPNDLVATSGELLQCLPSLVCSSLGFSVVVFFRTFSSSFFCAPTPARSRSSPAHLTRWGPRSISDQSWITTTSSPSLAPPPTSARGKSLLTAPPPPLPPPVCPPNRFHRRPACAPCTQSCADFKHIGLCIVWQGPALPLGEGCTGARVAGQEKWSRLQQQQPLAGGGNSDCSLPTRIFWEDYQSAMRDKKRRRRLKSTKSTES